MAIEELMSFLDSSPTSGHAAALAAETLEKAGFERRTEAGLLDGDPPDAFFVTRGMGTLIAARRGARPPAESGFRLACAHTDFPGLRLRNNPVRSLHGHSMLSVEIYGSPILPTWFDRDLGMAGTAVLRTGGGGYESRLFRLPGSVCRISMPAMHLNRGVNDEGFKFDKEEHLQAMISTGSLTEGDIASAVSSACGCPVDTIAGWNAHLVDTQPPALTGLRGEILAAQGIDDLALCHAGLTALLESGPGGRTAVLCLFDNEEVGSTTGAGAQSRFLDVVLESLAGSRRDFHGALLESIMVSIDGAHGLSPVHGSKFEKGNSPVMNGGPVIKMNSQERYATSALTSAYFRDCASRAGTPVQVFASRNDIPCGSTIGPILASRLGMPCVDAGNPVLSMHSIRECTGTADHGGMISILREHFRS